jgi:hypothetical protein
MSSLSHSILPASFGSGSGWMGWGWECVDKRRVVERVTSTMIYCQNLCKCYNIQHNNNFLKRYLVLRV